MPRHTSPMITLVIPKDLLQRIDDFRFSHRFRSRAATIKWLLSWALNKNPQPPNGSDQVQ